jgi:DNA-directed RNA polymerase subunit M
MMPSDKNPFIATDRSENYAVENMKHLHIDNKIQFGNDHDNNKDNDDVNEDRVDINSKEQDNIKDIHQYHQYPQNLQDQQPLTSSDILIIEPDKMPDTDPTTDTVVCSKCENHEAYWWIVQTDTAEEPSTQFFRCTKCKHTWRNPKSS